MWQRVGVIGTGCLGEQLIRMFVSRSSNHLPSVNVIGSYQSQHRKDELLGCFNTQLSLFDNNRTVVDKSDTVILSVKPGQIKNVCNEISPYLSENIPVISTAAAVPLDKLHDWLPSTKTIIRCMPNIPCGIGAGVAVYYSNSSEAKEIMENLFAPNLTICLNSDSEIDESTILSGSAPAFFSWYVDCLKNLSNKIPSESLNSMIAQTIVGTGMMLHTHSSQDIIRMVASPKGATEAALLALNENKIDKDINNSLLSAKRRIETLASVL